MSMLVLNRGGLFVLLDYFVCFSCLINCPDYCSCTCPLWCWEALKRQSCLTIYLEHCAPYQHSWTMIASFNYSSSRLQLLLYSLRLVINTFQEIFLGMLRLKMRRWVIQVIWSSTSFNFNGDLGTQSKFLRRKNGHNGSALSTVLLSVNITCAFRKTFDVKLTELIVV